MPETLTKEKPIVFSAPMVRAILDGKKTQTRRIVTARNSTVNGYPGCQQWDHLHFDYDGQGYRTTIDGPNDTIFGCGPGVQYLHVPAWHPDDGEHFVCSYRVRPVYGVGDRLWVRETWLELRRGHWHDSGPKDRITNRYGVPRVNSIAYRADADSERCRIELGYKWKPSIFMPRWASRITLEVTDVRVQRLKDISEEDAISEGIEATPELSWWQYMQRGGGCVETARDIQQDDPDFPWVHRERVTMDEVPARDNFRSLWESINGHDSWNQNPWVWVISFRKVNHA